MQKQLILGFYLEKLISHINVLKAGHSLPFYIKAGHFLPLAIATTSPSVSSLTSGAKTFE